MSGDNSDQIEFWTGSTTGNWVAHEERMDELLAPLSQCVIERAGDAVLDIGCGSDATARR